MGNSADPEGAVWSGTLGLHYQSSHWDFENYKSKNAVFQKKLSFTILFYEDFSKSWSQRQKAGVKYSKSGVNEDSDYLPFFLHLLDTLLYGKTTLLKF